MNLVIIGGRDPNKMADALYNTFDSVKIVVYKDIVSFMDAVSVRSLDIHRMLLLQDGVEQVSDEQIGYFVEFIQASYPAMKLVTLCKDVEYVKYMGELFPGGNYAHFCISSLKGKMLVDLVSMNIDMLVKKYENLTYKVEQSMDSEIIDEIDPSINSNTEEEEVQGYIPPPSNKREKRGFLSKILGLGPKKSGNLIKEGGNKAIGQGVGVEEFSTGPETVDFGEIQQQEEEPIDFSVFKGDDISESLGGMNPLEDEAHSIMEKYIPNESDFTMPNFDEDVDPDFSGDSFDDYGTQGNELKFHIDIRKKDEEEQQGYVEDNENKVSVSLEKEDEVEEYSPILDIEETENSNFDMMENDVDLNIPSVDLEDLKKTIEESNIGVQQPLPERPIMPNVNINDTDIDDTNLEDWDMGSLMSNYEEANKQVVEKVVEKVVERVVRVGGGEGSFRNKNGVKILVITGDRRIGCTKLAMNLASIYSKREKVLYVDFDRYRHGALGYMNIEDILEEPEHIQNGVDHLKSLNILNNVVYLFKKGGFYSLLSLYGNTVSDEQMIKTQEVLTKQREYTTVIIDCPIENLYLLKDILHVSNVLICAEDDKVGLINLITMLSSSFEDEKYLSLLFDKSYFVVGRRGNVEKFEKEMNEVADLFSFEETLFDWSKIEVIGTIKGTPALAERVGD